MVSQFVKSTFQKDYNASTHKHIDNSPSMHVMCHNSIVTLLFTKSSSYISSDDNIIILIIYIQVSKQQEIFPTKQTLAGRVKVLIKISIIKHVAIINQAKYLYVVVNKTAFM